MTAMAQECSREQGRGQGGPEHGTTLSQVSPLLPGTKAVIEVVSRNVLDKSVETHSASSQFGCAHSNSTSS
ncbi:uncharacterized protein J3R85_008041 [Psidium guajava]|nr:uncharacterized protein J3R85_008041 [Psidium guajava]